MAADRSGSYLHGLLVPDPRISTASIVAKDHGSVPSSYTQAGPRTGPAVATSGAIVLRTTGAQSEDGALELLTTRAGGVGPDGAGFVWRDTTVNNTYLGWDAYSLITGWESLLWTEAAQGANPRPKIIRLLSGKLMCAYSVTTLGVIRIKVYSPSTSAWTSADLAPDGAGSGYIAAAIGLCQLPTGRILAYVPSYGDEQVDLYFSDDDGANWTTGGYRVLSPKLADGATITEIAVAHNVGEILMVVAYNDGADDTADQYASSDGGTRLFQTFYDVEANAGGLAPKDIDVIPTPGGGFVAIFRDSAATAIQSVRFGSAWRPWDLADAVTVAGSNAAYSNAAWADESGIVYDVFSDNLNYGPYLYRSLDYGVTWEVAHSGNTFMQLQSGADTDRFQTWSAASIGGRAALVTRWVAAGGNEDPMSVGVLWLGGSSTHTAPGKYLPFDFSDFEQVTWGTQAIAGYSGLSWFPCELPNSLGWTETNSGVFVVDLISPGVGEFDTTAGHLYYDKGLTERDEVFYEFAVELDSGDGSLASPEIALRVRLADASSFQYTVTIHLASTGWRLYDDEAAAAVGADVTADLTARHVIRVVMGPGTVRTWYATAANHGQTRRWTTGPTGTITDAGATANSSKLWWGHLTTTTSTSRWYWLGLCAWTGRWGPSYTELASESWASPDALHTRHYPTAGPSLVHDGVFIEALAGPGYISDALTIDAAYDYPVGAMLPSVSPSPSRPWRSKVDGVDVAIVWDLESETKFGDSFWESSSIGMFLRETNLQSCQLQGWNGAAWVNLLPLDPSLGYTSLPYVRKGREVHPDTGAAAPTDDLWSFHQMHAGDTIKLELDEGTGLRRIDSNAEGAWHGGTKLARLMLDPDSCDGSEAASGTATIYRRNCGIVGHNRSTYYRYIRLYIPAQDTVDGYYKIGSLCVGPVFPFGLQPGNGWSWERMTNTEVRTRDDGGRSSRVRGPQRRAVEISWSTQPQDTTQVWGGEPTPDYVTGVSAGDPVASWRDTAEQVMGLIDRMDGADAPVVYIGRLPRGSGKQTFTQDPLWLYGRATTDTASHDHIVGDEGSSAAVRGNRLRIEEEV